MSKGSKQRPTDYEKYAANYDRIFRKEVFECTFPSNLNTKGSLVESLPKTTEEALQRMVSNAEELSLYDLEAVNKEIKRQRRQELLDDTGV